MCAACEDRDQAGLSPQLLAQARALEARMAGPRVPDEAWRILAGEQGGAIAWAHHRRMLESLDAVRLRRAFGCQAA